MRPTIKSHKQTRNHRPSLLRDCRDETFKDGVEIQADDFYSRLQMGGRTPTTSQPTPSDFQEVYSDLIGRGDQVISIHVSSKLSGTLNSAEQARNSLASVTN
ncbi:MAG: hypothetical protein CM1200mP27_02440 [Chloroflexota bacterium]|nr:MAG: hypothetical protein CM1200mP27_02440 [Chloroflexota bacterium]